MKPETYHEKLNRGFTIIELIVVLAVFLLIIGTAIAIFISIVQNQKRILAEEELLNQISYVAEYMSKALRMAKADETGDCLGLGYIYLLTREDSSGNFYRGIKFLNQSDGNVCQEFYLDNSGPQPVLKEKKIYPPYSPAGDDKAVALTSEKFKISSIRFGINGSDGTISGGTNNASITDGRQPKITIVLDIQSQNPAGQTKKIQTTVSQRNLNVK